MQFKKAQVTVFILIGIVIIIAAIIFLTVGSFTDNKSKTTVTEQLSPLELDVMSVKGFVTDCLKQTTIDAIYYVGSHGGYFNLEPVKSASTIYDTAYYFYREDYLVPRKQRVANEISDYIDGNIMNCINNFSVYKDHGFEFVIEESVTTTTLNANDVVVSMDLPITTSKNKEYKQVENFYVLEETRFGHLYDFAKILTDKQLLFPDYILLSDIQKQAEIDDLYVHIEGIKGTKTYFFTIIDNTTKPYSRLIFANEYNAYACKMSPPFADDTHNTNCVRSR